MSHSWMICESHVITCEIHFGTCRVGFCGEDGPVIYDYKINGEMYISPGCIANVD